MKTADGTRELYLAERISLGLMLLLEHAKAKGVKVDVSAKYGFFSASIPADKDLADLDKGVIETLGWESWGGGGYTIFLEE